MALPFTDKRRLLMLENKKEAARPISVQRIKDAVRLLAEAGSAFERREHGGDCIARVASQLQMLQKALQAIEKLREPMEKSRDLLERIHLREHVTAELAKARGFSAAQPPEPTPLEQFVPGLWLDHALSQQVDEVALGQALDLYALQTNQPNCADQPIPKDLMEDIRLVESKALLAHATGDISLASVLGKGGNGPQTAASMLVTELTPKLKPRSGGKGINHGRFLDGLKPSASHQATGYGLFGVMLGPEDGTVFAVEALGGTEWHARGIFAHAMKQRIAEPAGEEMNGHPVRRYPNGDPIVDVNSSGDGGTESDD
jgi:hypothetical protein